MKTITIVSFLSLLLAIVGIALHWGNLLGGATFTALGLSGVCLCLILTLIDSLRKSPKRYFQISFTITLILISVVLFIKYLYWSFFDWFSIITVLVFFFLIIFKFISTKHYKKSVDTGIGIVSGVYALLLIPTMIKFKNGPNMLVHPSVYNKLYDVHSVVTNIPIEYKLPETKKVVTSAKFFYGRGVLDSSLYYWKKAVMLEPANSNLRFNYTLVLQKNNDISIAIQQLDTIIRLAPNFYEAYSNRGLLKYKLGNNIDAIKDYDLAIQIDSLNPITYLNKALALNALHKKMEARHCLDIAEKRNKILKNKDTDNSIKNVDEIIRRDY